MSYLFLFLSVLAGVSKGFCGKRISAYTSEFRSAAFSNLIRMLFCIVIGFFFLLFDGGVEQLIPSTAFLFVSALSGVTTALFVIFWLFAIRRGAYVLVDVFLTLGTLLSAVLSIIFYGAEFSVFDGIGFAILILAALFLCSYSYQIKKGGMNIVAVILLFVCAAANGISDFAKEIFNRELGEAYTASAFNFYTFVFAALVLLIVFILSAKTETADNNIRILGKRGLPYIAMMSVGLFLNSFFKTLASEKLDMALLSPLSQGAALILVTVMSAVFFGEKIKPRCAVGLVLAIVGLIIMNLL